MTPLTDAERERLHRLYEEDAREYYRTLPPEDTIDPVPQAEVRQMTFTSFDLIHAKRPDIQCFNELMIRYPASGPGDRGWVVPNNWVAAHPDPIEVDDIFDAAVQPARPVLVVDYINDWRNPESYGPNFDTYERVLEVPYYLRIRPMENEWVLYRLAGGRYEVVSPDEAGRLPVPEFEVEVGTLNGRLRYWFRGELVKTPAEFW